MEQKTRIGAVSYLNTWPLVHGMRRGLGSTRIDLSFDHPAELADRMARGELDLALLPVIELARIPGLELVPGLGIVTYGASRSVLLVGKRPVERIETVALDAESKTSNALIQVLFADVWGRRPDFRTAGPSLRQALDGCDAAVRIGDKALFEPLPDRAYVYDLGTIWTEATGLPFVFAAWAGVPGTVDRELYRLLHQSRREGSQALDEIAERYTWRNRRYPQVVREYLERNIRFRLGSPEIRAIQSFLEAAQRLELIEKVPQIRMALQRRTRCNEIAEKAVAGSPAGGG